MNRKERIFQCVCSLVMEQNKKIGVDSVEIANKLGLDRSNVSRDLNELVREGRIVKKEGRPVLFMETALFESICEKIQEKKSLLSGEYEFEGMIGYNGSLKHQIEQGKSAVIYPPKGLHILFAGPTGTGKTTFAEELYNYAVNTGIMEKKDNFVIFNCAEYSQNPQLILSQLFGHKKGAYTGADKDKAGLVEKANGGVLFLDEIHRLPPEGQEMLFLLMDKGIYRRLGDTEVFLKADVLIMGATTENVNTALLSTFIRRMPVVINLPALIERPIAERLQMIEAFFLNEQKKIGVPIRVYKDVIITLLLYRCQGNIGQLQADIQLLCAQAFLKYKVKNLECVTIEFSQLPEYIKGGLLRQRESKNDLIEFLKYSDDYHIFESENELLDLKESVYDTISKKYRIFKAQGRSENQISDYLQKDIKQYLDGLKEKYRVDEREPGMEKLLKIVDARVYYAVEETIQIAEVKLERSFSDQAKVGMIMHVNAMIERLSNNTTVNGLNVNEVALNHPKEFRVAKIMLHILEEDLNITIPRHELAYLTMFLCVPEKQKHVGILILSHGKSTASSMADVANQLLNTDSCKAVDMPLDVSVDTTLEKTLEMVTQIDEGLGVLLLTDMGSLTMFGDMIKEKTDVRTRTITRVSMPIVLEATRKAMMSEVTLDEIYEDIKAANYEHISDKSAADKKYFFLTTCFTGRGTAKRIKDIIYELLPRHLTDRVSIKCMDFKQASDIKSEKRDLLKKQVHAVIGMVDLELDGVPYISVDELILGTGMDRLERILKNQEWVNTSNSKGDNPVSNNVLIETLRGILEFLDPEKIVPPISKSYKDIVENANKEFSNNLQIRYVVHLACMLERVIQGDILKHKDSEALKKQHSLIYDSIKNTLSGIENMLHIEIPDTEMAYLIEIITET